MSLVIKLQFLMSQRLQEKMMRFLKGSLATTFAKLYSNIWMELKAASLENQNKQWEPGIGNCENFAKN